LRRLTIQQQFTNSSLKIEDIGKVPLPPSYEEYTKKRIMEIVKRGTGGGWEYDEEIIPGIAKWSGIRYFLGGFYKTEAVREAVDSLLQEGKILEVWWHDGTRRKEAKHWVILPGLLDKLPGIHRIRGRQEIIPEELRINKT